MNESWIGKIIGGCRIESLIGKGGMGAIYLAHQIHLDRKVAVKLLSYKMSMTDSEKQNIIKRFQQEARLAAKLQHPNAVQIYDFGEDGDIYYIVMQYIEGVDLDAMVKEKGPVSIPEAIHILKEVAKALDAAHEQGIIHRDIKPANIMIKKDKSIVLTDFGLAKPLHIFSPLSSPGDCLGTLGYMSPEQASGQNVIDHRTDIYSLGASLFHLLTGNRPFEGSSPVEIIYKQVTSNPPDIQKLRPDIPVSLVKIIEMMMEKDIQKRFQSAKKLLKTVEEIEKRAGFLQGEKSSPRSRTKGRVITQLMPFPLLSGEQELAIRLKRYLNLSNIMKCYSDNCSQEWKLDQAANHEAAFFNGHVWCRKCLWDRFDNITTGARIGKYDTGSFGDYWLGIKGKDEFIPDEPMCVLYRLPLTRPKNGWDRMLKRIERGFSLAGQIHSNSLLKVGRYVENVEEGFAFVPIEYVAGITLDQLISLCNKANERLTIQESIVILRKLAHALISLHEKCIVHRNVTPGGIYIGLNGGVRLGNFTMAKSFGTQSAAPGGKTGTSFKEYCLEYWMEDGSSSELDGPGEITTNTKCALGTIAYMSPEQTQGAYNVDQRSDIWSWGIIAFELLEGSRPFPENTIWATVQAIREAELPKFSQKIPNSLQQIVYRAFQKNVEKRYQHATEIIEALDLQKPN